MSSMVARYFFKKGTFGLQTGSLRLYTDWPASRSPLGRKLQLELKPRRRLVGVVGFEPTTSSV